MAGSAFGVSAITLAAMLGKTNTVQAASDADALLAQPFGALETCVDCSNCGENGNKAFPGDATSWFEVGGGPHSTCYETGSCSLKHPPTCNISLALTAQLLEEVRAAVAAGKEAEVRLLLQHHSAQLSFVEERGAVQVLGCNDQVVAHFPLTHAIVASLSH